MNLTILSGVDSTASALAAERMRLQVIAQNIANASVTRGPDGRPYQRQQVVFESVLRNQQGFNPAEPGAQGVRVARVEQDRRPGRMIYNPGHPDANAQGMLALPNVNIHEEMADMIVASRSFEANLAAIKNARQIALQTLMIGRR